VAAWVKEGFKLSEIQNRIASHLGMRMTYMDVRLLVDDLKLIPEDVIPQQSVAPMRAAPNTAPVGNQNSDGLPEATDAKPADTTDARGSVSVIVDQIARAGSVVSGKVTFSDGNNADWYFDQTGRLGLVPEQPGFRPMPSDQQQFQAALESELSKMGF
jgi:hypothetical protein